MINLNVGRKLPLDLASIYLKDLPDIDLTTIQIYDWMEGIGNLNDYAIVGFLKQLGRIGMKICPIDPTTHKRL